MSFTDLLRRSRSSKTSVLHKFLTHYDPHSRRAYAFVEGHADEVFYKAHLRKYVAKPTDVFTYNCEGKSRVYDAYNAVIARFPDCRRVLFFVDKDVDDIIGRTWLPDPRIFTTDTYSIENYVVCRDALERYFANFTKLAHVEIDIEIVFQQFEAQIQKFYAMILPIMAWIVVIRRAGENPNLADVNLAELFVLRDGEIARTGRRNTVQYLQRVTQSGAGRFDWRAVRNACAELRRMAPKHYVRGKFEAWWFVSFVRDACTRIGQIAFEGGGRFSCSMQLNHAGLIQLLAAYVTTPQSLDAFARFHLTEATRVVVAAGKPAAPSFLQNVGRTLRNLVRSR